MTIDISKFDAVLEAIASSSFGGTISPLANATFKPDPELLDADEDDDDASSRDAAIGEGSDDLPRKMWDGWRKSQFSDAKILKWMENARFIFGRGRQGMLHLAKALDRLETAMQGVPMEWDDKNSIGEALSIMAAAMGLVVDAGNSLNANAGALERLKKSKG